MKINYTIVEKGRFWAGILLAQFILFYAFSKLPSAVKAFEFFFEIQKNLHLTIFSWIPVSVGDIFYISIFAFLFFIIVKIIRKKNIKKQVTRLFILLNIVYFFYQVFWGMLYFQQPIIENLSNQKPTNSELKAFSLHYLERCKKSRNLIKEDKNRVFRINDIDRVKKEILINQREIPRFINGKLPVEERSIKPSIFKKLMSYTGIYGYYNPFTAEAQYNEMLPSTSLAFTIAHETAHQIGYAREQEANFIGFLIGRNSKDPELRYSTDFFVLRSLLNALSTDNPDFVHSVIENYSPGMQRDSKFEKEFRKQHKGWLDTFFGYANDIFLKTNQQEGSITYSYFVDLLIRYEREENKKNRVSQHDSKNTNDEKKFIALEP